MDDRDSSGKIGLQHLRGVDVQLDVLRRRFNEDSASRCRDRQQRDQRGRVVSLRYSARLLVMLVEVSFGAESGRVSVAGQIRICGDFEAESVG